MRHDRRRKTRPFLSVNVASPNLICIVIGEEGGARIGAGGPASALPLRSENNREGGEMEGVWPVCFESTEQESRRAGEREEREGGR